MPVGFQVFNADGSLQFDTTNRLYRVIDQSDISASAGSKTIAGLSSQGTVVPIFSSDGEDDKPRAVSVSGNTVSWTAGTAGKLTIAVY